MEKYIVKVGHFWPHFTIIIIVIIIMIITIQGELIRLCDCWWSLTECFLSKFNHYCGATYHDDNEDTDADADAGDWNSVV